MTRTDDAEVAVLMQPGHVLHLEWLDFDGRKETVAFRFTSTGPDRRSMLHIHGASGAIEAFTPGGGGMVLTALGA